MGLGAGLGLGVPLGVAIWNGLPSFSLHNLGSLAGSREDTAPNTISTRQALALEIAFERFDN